MNERFRSLPDDLRPRGRCHCCQVDEKLADRPPRYWVLYAIKCWWLPVVRKKEDRNSLRQNREGDAREIELEASLMS